MKIFIFVLLTVGVLAGSHWVLNVMGFHKGLEYARREQAISSIGNLYVLLEKDAVSNEQLDLAWLLIDTELFIIANTAEPQFTFNVYGTMYQEMSAPNSQSLLATVLALRRSENIINSDPMVEADISSLY